jgi:hypothetical protein
MIRTLLLFLALGACEKTNDVATLHDEAITVQKFDQPRLEVLAKRIDDCFQRGHALPQTQPGIGQAGPLLGRARDKLVELRGQVASIDKEADELAKKGDTDGLAWLIDERREKLEHGLTEVNDEVGSVESWLAQVKALPPPPVAEPPPTPDAPTPPPK